MLRVYVGIDIGNGEIKVAIVDPAGRTVVIRNASGGKSWPSYVFHAPDGSVIIGEDARQQGIIYPLQVAHGWKMEFANPAKLYFGGTASASDVLAKALPVIIAQAEKQCGLSIDGALVTWPAIFTDAEKQGLLDGFAKAKVPVVGSMTEPSSAAYDYLWKDQAGMKGDVSYICCADLGHGTFDVSVLEAKDGDATPISTEGVAKLGGRNFTKIIKRMLLEKLGKEFGKPLTLDKLAPEQAAELDEKAEKAKHALSGQASTKVALTCAGKPRLIEIAQTEYHNDPEYKSLEQQIVACLDKAMSVAKKEWKDLRRFVLAGGAFLAPRLQELGANHTGLVPCVETDPSSVVSFGAARHAHNLGQKEGGSGTLPPGPVVREALGHDIGLAVIDEVSGKRDSVCTVLASKNTPVPHECGDRFRLERPNQSEVCIEILQGPNGTPSIKCAKIGVIHLKGLPPEPQRTPRIEVACKFDSNTLATVTVKDLLGGGNQTASVKIPK